MRHTVANQSRRWYTPATLFLLVSLAALSTCSLIFPFGAVRAEDQPLRITANFSAQEPVAPNARLELRTTRPLLPGEGRLAVFINETDVTALYVKDDGGLAYTPGAIPLPLGEMSVIVYLVSTENRWREIARLPLLVEEPKRNVPATKGYGNGKDTQPPATDAPPVETPPKKNEGPDPFQFIPSVSVNIKAQSVALFFPDSSRPDRINFTDIAVQASPQGNYTRGPLSVQNQFDLVGSSVQNEALRFGQLGNKAMQVDLSSYLMQYRFNKLQLRVGHISFGTSRHLISSFSSRGISLSVPITKRFDLSVAGMNGTSIVGFDNFFGLSRSKHQIMSGTLGIEMLPKRPGGLRIEVGALGGSLLPLSNFNQSNVNDAERSRGASLRVIASDKAQRFRLDTGFARSRFTNPADPLLYQGRNVVGVVPVSRNARYLDVSYDLFRGLTTLSENWKLNLSLAYRHERVDPLYRSVAASAQADRLNNQFDVNGSVGDITVAFNYTQGNDNLAEILSILKTITRRNGFILGVPTASLFGDGTKPSMWLPRLSYNMERVHQFSPFVPVNGDFLSPSQIPDQVSTNQSFVAEWLLWQKVRASYRFNHSFLDSRQLGRERSDVQDQVNSVGVGFNPLKTLSLNFDVNAERSSNFEQNTGNSNLRFGTNLTWNMTGRMVWAMNLSTTLAGDRADTNDRRDADFDLQYSWRFLSTEKNRWQKVQGQFFIRYANRYGQTRDRLFGFNSLTKLQTFNAGLNFTFF